MGADGEQAEYSVMASSTHSTYKRSICSRKYEVIFQPIYSSLYTRENMTIKAERAFAARSEDQTNVANIDKFLYREDGMPNLRHRIFNPT